LGHFIWSFTVKHVPRRGSKGARTGPKRAHLGLFWPVLAQFGVGIATFDRKTRLKWLQGLLGKVPKRPIWAHLCHFGVILEGRFWGILYGLLRSNTSFGEGQKVLEELFGEVPKWPFLAPHFP
jgi:hypothetical protein